MTGVINTHITFETYVAGVVNNTKKKLILALIPWPYGGIMSDAPSSISASELCGLESISAVDTVRCHACTHEVWSLISGEALNPITLERVSQSHHISEIGLLSRTIALSNGTRPALQIP